MAVTYGRRLMSYVQLPIIDHPICFGLYGGSDYIGDRFGMQRHPFYGAIVRRRPKRSLADFLR